MYNTICCQKTRVDNLHYFRNGFKGWVVTEFIIKKIPPQWPIWKVCMVYMGGSWHSAYMMCNINLPIFLKYMSDWMK